MHGLDQIDVELGQSTAVLGCPPAHEFNPYARQRARRRKRLPAFSKVFKRAFGVHVQSCASSVSKIWLKALELNKPNLCAQLSFAQMPRHRTITDPQTFQVFPWQQKRKHPGCDQPEYTQSRFSVGPKSAGLEQTPSSTAELDFVLPDQPDADPTAHVISTTSEEEIASFEAVLALMDAADYQGRQSLHHNEQ